MCSDLKQGWSLFFSSPSKIQALSAVYQMVVLNYCLSDGLSGLSDGRGQIFFLLIITGIPALETPVFHLFYLTFMFLIQVDYFHIISPEKNTLYLMAILTGN